MCRHRESLLHAILWKSGSDKISVESREAPDTGGLINQLYCAILNTEQLRINYYSCNESAVLEFVIDLYALAFRGHAWYLAAFCHTRYDVLMFKTNCIKTLGYTRRTFSYPPDFSLEEYMDAVEKYSATVEKRERYIVS